MYFLFKEFSNRDHTRFVLFKGFVALPDGGGSALSLLLGGGLLADDPESLEPAAGGGPSGAPLLVRLGFSNPSRFAILNAKTASPVRGFLHTFRASSALTSSGWNSTLFILSTSLLAEAGSALNATSPSAGLSVNIRGTMPWKFSDSKSSASAGHSAASAVGMLHLNSNSALNVLL